MDDWNEWSPAHDYALAEWMVCPEKEPSGILGDASALRSATQWLGYFFDLERPLIQTLGVLLDRAATPGAASMTTHDGSHTVSTGRDVRCIPDGDEAALLDVLDDVLATGTAPNVIGRPDRASRVWQAAGVRSGRPAHVLVAFDARTIRSLGYLEGQFSPHVGGPSGDVRHARKTRRRVAAEGVRDAADKHEWARPSLSDEQTLTADVLLDEERGAGYGIFEIEELSSEYRIRRLYAVGEGWPDAASPVEAVFKADAGLVRHGDRLERSAEPLAPEDLREKLPPPPNPDPVQHQAIDRVRDDELRSALMAVLSPAVAAVVEDRRHGLGIAAIAERRSTAVGTVKTQLHKAREVIVANLDALDLDHETVEALGHALRDDE
jgi:hypothetical protein